MPTKTQLLDAALDVLRQQQGLTLDAVARSTGMTKPGVVHHFPSKAALSLAVVDHVLDRWEAELNQRAGAGAGQLAKLHAYIDYALTGDLDAADLAIMADPRLRERLTERWSERMDPWFGGSAEPSAPLVAARLIADGAWVDRSLGMLELGEEKRDEVVRIAVSLSRGSEEPC